MRIGAKKKWTILAAKFFVTAAILWLVAREIGVSTARIQIHTLCLVWLALAFTLFLAQIVLNSLRWSLLVPLDDAELTFSDALRIYLEGAFFNQALPTTVGGDAVRIYRVVKLGHRLGQAINGVLLDRLAGSIGLVILMIAGLIPFVAMVDNPAARLGFVTVLAMAALAVVLVLLLGLTGKKWRLRGFAHSAVHFADLARRMLMRPSMALPALGLAVMGHLSIVTGTWSLAMAAGIGADWLSCFTIVPTAILISMIPISVAGWGVREGAMATGFALIGMGAEVGFLLSIGVGLMLLSVGLIGAFVWFRGVR